MKKIIRITAGLSVAAAIATGAAFGLGSAPPPSASAGNGVCFLPNHPNYPGAIHRSLGEDRFGTEWYLTPDNEWTLSPNSWRGCPRIAGVND